MRNFEELKQLLIEVKDNDYNVPIGVDVDSVIADMLKFIGHTDAELRDGLIYKTFMQWGEEKGIFSAEQMKHILNTCLSETHLFLGIGEKDTDSVFTRSFSSLVITVVLWINENEISFLTSTEIFDIKKTVLHYISQEKDYRGYVDGKGWAHAIAHIADVLGHLAEASKAVDVDDDFCIEREGLLEVLDAVKVMVCNADSVYTTGEDERLAVPVMDVIYREVLTNEEIISWIDSLNAEVNAWQNGAIPNKYYLYFNYKSFMRSLYFKLLSDGDYDEICQFVLGFLVESDDE